MQIRLGSGFDALRQCPDALRAPSPSRAGDGAVRVPHNAEMSSLPKEWGWDKEQPRGALLLSSPCTFQDMSLACEGSPDTHTPKHMMSAAAGDRQDPALVPGLWPESLAAPDPTCNLHQLISSSSCLN